ncbi:MAG TPA: methyltransferase domain-containing protein [Solirubrobacteraceae bacterium]|nr:methyltransferase domain-containing protein [Solirubrobacteraceae bacterium]
MAIEPDRWSRWLRERRDAGDEQRRAFILQQLAPVRDRVLGGAEPLAGATLLDVGTGDGLVGLGALERVGPDGTVIFSDVSPALLEHAREAVAARGLLDRARFVQASADDLAAIPDASVDAVTTRSVLIYVADKPRAFAAMHRVLAPGGRLSLFEPINRLTSPEPADRFWGYDVGEVWDLADKVKASYGDLEDPAVGAMTDFDDRDLVAFAEAAGFERIHMECHIDIEPSPFLRATSVDILLDTAPNPLAPTVRESVAAALTAAEQEHFLAHLARAIAAGDPIRRSALAYLAATKRS